MMAAAVAAQETAPGAGPAPSPAPPSEPAPQRLERVEITAERANEGHAFT